MVRGESLGAAQVRNLRGTVALGPGLRHDEQHSQFAVEDRVRRMSDDIDRRLVDLARLPDRGEQHAHRRGGRQRALHGKDDVVGGQRRAVVEAHALPQPEAPHIRCRARIGFGQRRRAAHILVEAHQAFVDPALHCLGARHQRAMRIERQRIAFGRVAQGLGRGSGGQKGECKRRDKRARNEADRH
jgi:hypothetical protein